MYIAGAYSQQETPTNCDWLAPTASSHRNCLHSQFHPDTSRESLFMLRSSGPGLHPIPPTIRRLARRGVAQSIATQRTLGAKVRSRCASDRKHKAETIQGRFATDVLKQGRYASPSSTTVDVYHIWGARSVFSRPLQNCQPRVTLHSLH
jgi:hypothetical protein